MNPQNKLIEQALQIDFVIQDPITPREERAALAMERNRIIREAAANGIEIPKLLSHRYAGSGGVADPSEIEDRRANLSQLRHARMRERLLTEFDDLFAMQGVEPIADTPQVTNLGTVLERHNAEALEQQQQEEQPVRTPQVTDLAPILERHNAEALAQQQSVVDSGPTVTDLSPILERHNEEARAQQQPVSGGVERQQGIVERASNHNFSVTNQIATSAGRAAHLERATQRQQQELDINAATVNSLQMDWGVDPVTANEIIMERDALLAREEANRLNEGNVSGQLDFARSVAETMKDFGLDLSSSVIRLGQAAYEAANFVSGVTGEKGALESATGFGEKISGALEGIRSFRSSGLQDRQTAVDMNNERFLAGREERLREARISAGRTENNWADHVGEFFDGVVQGGGEVLRNPAILGSMLAENSMDFIGPGLIRSALSKAGALASGKLVKDGLKNVDADELASLINRENMIIGTAVNAGMEGGATAADARSEVLDMSFEDLERTSEVYRGLIESGLTPELARNAIANNVAATTFAISAGTSVLTSTTLGTGRLEAAWFKPAEGGVDSIRANVMRVALNTSLESIDEMIQGTAGSVGTDLAIRDQADNTREIGRTAGIEAGAGGVVGGVMGGGATTISNTARTIAGVSNRSRILQNFKERVNEEIDVNNALEEVGDAPLPEAAQSEDGEVNPDSFAVYSDRDSEHYSPIRALGVVLSPKYMNRDAVKNDIELGKQILDKAYELAFDSLDEAQYILQEESSTPEQKRMAASVIEMAQERVARIGELSNLLAQSNDAVAIENFWKANADAIVEGLVNTDEGQTDDQVRSAIAVLGSDIGSIPQPLIERALASEDESLREQGRVIQQYQNSLRSLQNVNKGKSLDQVMDDIFEGSEGALGLSNYNNVIRTAIRTGNTVEAQRFLGLLSNFASRHTDKAQEANYLFGEFKKAPENRAADFDDRMSAYVQRFSQKDESGKIIEDAYINERSGKLVQQISREAEAITAMRNALVSVVNNVAQTRQEVVKEFKQRQPTQQPTAEDVTPGERSEAQEVTESEATVETEAESTTETEATEVEESEDTPPWETEVPESVAIELGTQLNEEEQKNVVNAFVDSLNKKVKSTKEREYVSTLGTLSVLDLIESAKESLQFSGWGFQLLGLLEARIKAEGQENIPGEVNKETQSKNSNGAGGFVIMDYELTPISISVKGTIDAIIDNNESVTLNHLRIAILHELVHVVSVKSIETNSSVKAEIRALMDATRIAKINTKNLNSYGKHFNKFLDYMLTNEMEFLAVALSDPEIMMWLREQPGIKQNKSLFQSIVDSVAKLLGLKTNDNTLLSNVIEISAKHLETTTGTKKGMSRYNIWAGSNENAHLSNLAYRPFMYEGRNYISVEHAYQTLKSGAFDQQTYDAYRALDVKKSPYRKIVGKLGTNTENNWNIKLMESLISHSFSPQTSINQLSPIAQKMLLNTGEAQLTHTQDRGVWKTVFPDILMKVRSKLREGGIDVLSLLELKVFDSEGKPVIDSVPYEVGQVSQTGQQQKQPITESEALVLAPERQELVDRVNALPDAAITSEGRQKLISIIENGNEARLEKATQNIEMRERRVALAKEAEASQQEEVEDYGTPIRKPKVSKKQRAKNDRELRRKLEKQLADSVVLNNEKVPGLLGELFKQLGLKKKEILTKLMEDIPESGLTDNPKLYERKVAAMSIALLHLVQYGRPNIKRKNDLDYMRAYHIAEAAIPNKYRLLNVTVQAGRRFNQLKWDSKAGKFVKDAKALVEAKFSEVFAFGKNKNPLSNDPDIVEKLTTVGHEYGIDAFIREYKVNDPTAKMMRDHLQPFLANYLEAARALFKGKEHLPDTNKQAIMFFQDKRTGKLDERVVMATGIAAFSYINNEGRQSMKMDMQALKSYLNLDSTPTREQMAMYKYAGQNRSHVQKTIGRNVTSMVGLKVRKDLPDGVPGTLNENLQMSIGQFALDVLSTEQMGLMEQRRIHTAIEDSLRFRGTLPEGHTILETQEPVHYLTEAQRIEINNALPENATKYKPYEGTWFVRLKLEFEGDRENGIPRAKVPDPVDQMFTSFRVQDALADEGAVVFDDIFGTERLKAYPSFKPRAFKQENLKGSFQKVSERVKQILTKNQARPLTVNTNMRNTLDVFSEDFFVTVGIGQEIDSITKFELTQSGESAQDNIRDSLKDTKEWLSVMDEQEQSQFYIEWVQWKNMRMGVQSSINPQNSKLMRHVFGYADHKRTYKAGDSKSRFGLMLAFGQALGIKIDIDNADAIKNQLRNLIGEITEAEYDSLPVDVRRKRDLFINAIGHLQAIQYDANLKTPEIESEIQAAVLAAGEGFHSLHGLVEMAAVMEMADEGGFRFKKEDFDTDMVIEIDGKTNGVAFGLLQIGGDREDAILMEQLAKVGVFIDGETMSLAEYREANPDFTDIYETVGGEWKREIDSFKQQFASGATEIIISDFMGKPVFEVKPEVFNAVIDLMGDLSKDLRKVSKSPVMTTMYGQGLLNAARKYAEEALVTFHKKVAKGEVEQHQIEALGIKLTKQQERDLYENRLEFVLTPEQQKIFVDAVYETHGAAMYEAFSTGFLSNVLENQRAVNTGIQQTFKVFHYAYKKNVEAKMAELGRELTAEERREIVEGLMHIAPVYRTMYSDDDNSGVNPMKSALDEQVSELAKLVQTYDEAINNSNSTTAKGGNLPSATSTTYADREAYSDPGVGGVVAQIHALDAQTMLYFLDSEITGLNIHDAVILAAADFIEGGNVINSGFYEANKSVDIVDLVLEKYSASMRYARNVLGIQNPIKTLNGPMIGLILSRLDVLFQMPGTKEKTLGKITAVNQYASLLGGVVIDSPVSDRELDTDSLGSTGESFDDSFTPTDTFITTQGSLQAIMDRFKSIDGARLTQEHEESLQRLSDTLFGLAGEVEIRLQEKADKNQGRYLINENGIDIKTTSPLFTTNSDMTATEVYAHEMTHAVLHQALKLSSAAKKRFEEVFNYVADNIPEDWFVDKSAPQADQQRQREIYNYIFGGATQRTVRKQDPITGAVRPVKDSAGLDEFIAYALTNRRMQEYLAKPEVARVILKGEIRRINPTKSKSFVTQAFDAVYRKIYGWFQDIIQLFQNRVLLKLDSSQTAEQMMLSLAKQVADVSLRNKRKLNKGKGYFDKANQFVADQTSNAVLKGLKILGGKPPTTSASDLGTMGRTGRALRYAARSAAVAMQVRKETVEAGGEDVFAGNHTTKKVIETVANIRRNMKLKADGLMATLAREMVGQNSSNRKAYGLQRLSTNIVDRLQTNTARSVSSFLVNSYTRDLTKHERSSLGRVVLNTDLAALLSDKINLNTMTIEEVEAYMADPKNQALRQTNLNYIQNVVADNMYRQKEIRDIESAISQLMGNSNKAHAVHYLKMARALGRWMITGKTEQHNQMKNAHAIANLVGSGLQKTGKEAEAEVLINKLATLIALDSTNADDRDTVSQIISEEFGAEGNTYDDNGFTKTLVLAMQAQKQSMDSLFHGNPMQMIKGYTKQVLDDRVDVIIASVAQEKELRADGYTPVSDSNLPRDVADNLPESMQMYISTTGKTRTYNKQIFSLHNNKARGMTIQRAATAAGIEGAYSPGFLNSEVDQILNTKMKLMKQLRMNLDPQNDALMMPVLNEQGEIVDYSYVMTENTKKLFLDKQDMFDLTLGGTIGATVAKPSAKMMNDLAVDTLKEIYINEFAENPKRFVRIAPDALDDENKEYWFMLPYETRKRAEEQFGKKELWVPDDMRRLFFGYRKQTASDIVRKGSEYAAEKLGEKSMVSSMLKHMAYMLEHRYFRTFEDMWQEIVSMAKDAIVIKTGVVLAANMMSNNVVLAMEGLGPLKLYRYQKEGWDAIDSFQRAQDEIAKIELELETNKGLSLSARKNLQNKLSRVNAELAKNPALDLLTSGVYQSIVEDVGLEEEVFTFKGNFERLAEPLVSRIPEAARDAANLMFITHDTRLYKTLRNATQKSDFVARYALHRHNMENGMSYSDSVNRIMDSFVDYETPTHPTVQYLNDMGLLMFTKFFFRIQKVILRQFSEKTAETFTFFILSGLTGLVPPSIFDAMGLEGRNWQNRMYSPFDNLEAIYKGNLNEFGFVEGLLK